MGRKIQYDQAASVLEKQNKWQVYLEESLRQHRKGSCAARSHVIITLTIAIADPATVTVTASRHDGSLAGSPVLPWCDG